MTGYRMLIGGQLLGSQRAIDVINPATGRPFAQCPVADPAMLDSAVAAARLAQPAWAALSVDARAGALLSLADALEADAAGMAALLTEEQGKPLPQAAAEVAGAVHILRAFAAMRLEPQLLRDDARGRVSEIRRPLGVVAAIMPWNFPVALIAQKIAPALLTGNCIVCKPAPTTPLTALRLAELCAPIFPAGVVNVICDDNDLGSALCRHPGIDKISFTGSTATGRKVMASAAETLKRITLELGGNDAAIVLDDVDPEDTAREIFQGAMANAGQICIAVKRAYVPESLYERFCASLASLAREAVVDDGSRQGAEIGPVQNRAQYEKLKDLLADCCSAGTILAGGHAIERDGYFIAPTIVADVADDARIVTEEQFGPVLPVLRYTDLEEAIARANDTVFGLGGSVWGKDVARATEVAMRVESGTVWVNQHRALSADIPFAGAKQSGLGVELGLRGLEEYTQATIINVRTDCTVDPRSG